jgi:hypothetical protein
MTSLQDAYGVVDFKQKAGAPPAAASNRDPVCELYAKSLEDYKSPLLSSAAVNDLPAYYPYERGSEFRRTEATLPETVPSAEQERTVPEPAVVDVDRELAAYADDAMKRVSPQQASREELEEVVRSDRKKQLDVLLYSVTGLLLILCLDLAFRIGVARGIESALANL